MFIRFLLLLVVSLFITMWALGDMIFSTWPWPLGPGLDKPTDRQVRFARISTFITLVLTGMTAFTATRFGTGIVHTLIRVIGLHTTQVLIVVSVLFVGWLASIFKSKNQVLYGAVEVVFAFMCTFQIALTLPDDKPFQLSQWIALGGFAYVVARGFNNLSDGRKAIARWVSENLAA